MFLFVFDNQMIPVTFVGTDQKKLPSLQSALRSNKLTLNRIKQESLAGIDLYGSEAILHTPKGNRYRIPLF